MKVEVATQSDLVSLLKKVDIEEAGDVEELSGAESDLEA